MYGKVKRQRAAGKRLSDLDIARANFVQGEVTVFGMAGSIMASVVAPNSQVGESLISLLCDAKLTKHGTGMLSSERAMICKIWAHSASLSGHLTVNEAVSLGRTEVTDSKGIFFWHIICLKIVFPSGGENV